MSCRGKDNLGVGYVHRKVKETKGGQSTNEKIRGIDIRMTSTSPSEQTTSMSKEQNRAMRKKDRNMGRDKHRLKNQSEEDGEVSEESDTKGCAAQVVLGVLREGASLYIK